MRTENDALLHVSATRELGRKPLTASEFPDEQAHQNLRMERRYAVEVCWPRFGRITCRTYLVRAQSDKEAAAKGRAEARRQMRGLTHLEVVDLARLEVAETLFGREGTR